MGCNGPRGQKPRCQAQKQGDVIGLKLKTRWRTQKQDGGCFEDGGMAFVYVK